MNHHAHARVAEGHCGTSNRGKLCLLTAGIQRAFAVSVILLSLFGLCSPVRAFAANSSYVGTLATDDDKKLFYFTSPASGLVTLRTFSYAGGVNQAGSTIPAGGFDPTLIVYNANGSYVTDNRDAGCSLATADPVTAFCWDARLDLTLQPNTNYFVVLTQSDNLPNGPTIGDGFIFDSQTTFTTPIGVGSQGFWDLFPSKRTSSYALDILGGSSVITGITSAAPRFGVAGAIYTPYAFTATSGPGVVLTWSVSGGTLPPGLTLDPDTGFLSGTPTISGGYTFTVQASDGIQPVTQSVSMTVYSRLGITSLSFPDGTSGSPYGPAGLGFAGGGGNNLWSASGLPPGLSMDASGSVSGTPTRSGSYAVAVTLQDQTSGQSATAVAQIVIKVGPLSISGPISLGGYVPGGKISGSLSATGGLPPLTFSAPGLPQGLSLNGATGGFSGTAGAAGTHSFTAQVTDSQSPPGTSSTAVTYSVLGFTSSSLPSGAVGTAYSASLSAIGGTAPYSFSASGLPNGLTMTSAGVISGAKPPAGTFNFAAQVSDATGLNTSALFSVTINGPANGPLTISGTSLSIGIVGTPYSASVQATGGNAPYKYVLLAGTLPAGLSLTDSGTLQGTPTSPGDYSFSAQVTDANGSLANGSFSVSISAAPLTLTLGTFPAGVVGSDYPVQILTPAGGASPYTFSVSSGSLPSGLTLSGNQISGVPTAAGTSSFSIKVTDFAGKVITASGSIVIKLANADLILSQTSVSFSLTAGANGLPTPASVTLRSSVVQQILTYSYAVSPAAPWLNVSGGGSTPGSLSLALDPTAPSQSVGTYSTVISVSCLAPSPCAGVTQNISVSLGVTAPPAQLTLTPDLLQFSATGANPTSSTKSMGLQNSGGGVITVNSVTAGDTWLSVSGAPKTLTAGPGQSVNVTANPAGLVAGFYQSSVTVNSSAGSSSAPVTLLVTPAVTLSLGSGTPQITVPQGNPPGNTSGSFPVSVIGDGIANWTAALQPGSTSNWLTVNTASGTASSATAGTVSYSLNSTAVAALQVGTYYANIQVTSADAANSPQTYQVVLTVTAVTTSVKPVLSASGIVFTAQPGDTGASALITVYASSSSLIGYQASASANDGGSWLSVSPTTGTTSASAPGSSRVFVNFTGLAPGTYRGGVSFAYSSDAVRTVNITVRIPQTLGTVSSLTGADGKFLPQAVTCAPKSMIATQTGLYNNFAQQAGWPAPIAIQLIDDCGNPVSNARVTATFSNGDPQLSLVALNKSSGIYNGTWTPQGVSPQVTVTASVSGLSLPSDTATVTGEVRANAVPIITRNGTVDAFNPRVGAALAPGEIIAIYGTNLASQTVTGNTVPLANSLGGTSVQIGNFSAPVYFVSAGQVNAQVPYEVTAGTTYPVQVTANGNSSTVASVQVVSTAPGVASSPSGQIIAQHAADYSLVSATSPAKAGEFIVLYLGGLGQVDNAVPTGGAALANPLSRPIVTPVLTLNGNVIPVAFAGLSPSFVGLGQINFQVPAGTAAGDLTLTVSQGLGGATRSSNTTIIPVR